MIVGKGNPQGTMQELCRNQNLLTGYELVSHLEDLNSFGREKRRKIRSQKKKKMSIKITGNVVQISEI